MATASQQKRGHFQNWTIEHTKDIADKWYMKMTDFGEVCRTLREIVGMQIKGPKLHKELNKLFNKHSPFRIREKCEMVNVGFICLSDPPIGTNFDKMLEIISKGDDILLYENVSKELFESLIHISVLDPPLSPTSPRAQVYTLKTFEEMYGLKWVPKKPVAEIDFNPEMLDLL